MNNNISNIKEIDCTGCLACLNVCPKDAIDVKANGIGTIFPTIDDSLCVNCGLCLKKCPSLLELTNKDNQKVFASWCKNIDYHLKSSSGGIATLLSERIIEKGGVVYGCTSQGSEIFHTRIDDVVHLDKLRGSKYVQSEIGMSYKNVLQDLSQNIFVLFVGTPCQVAGLKAFLGKEYDNLITIDLVCHGALSQKILFDSLEYNGLDKTDISSVSFRNNYSFSLQVFGKDKKLLYKKDDFQDPFYMIFEDAVGFRESCVNCKYARSNRVGDITLGDFHRINQKEDFNYQTNGGVSLVITNSSKGFLLFCEISDSVFSVERSFDDALSSNSQLSRPTRRKGNYSRFLKIYTEKGFRKAFRKCLRKRRLKNMVLLFAEKLKGIKK